MFLVTYGLILITKGISKVKTKHHFITNKYGVIDKRQQPDRHKKKEK